MRQLITKISITLMSLFLVVSLAQAQSTATGTITDAAGIPLIGVNVIVKGTVIGTATDLDGNYSLKVPEGATELEISYTGFETQTIDISSGSASSIIMSEGSSVLDEVVVTGLATSVKRSNLANSVASISSTELTGVTVATTTDAALYGKFKGAEIRANSGAPGGGISIKTRGTTSINGSSQPLIIMDGVYIDNSSIPAGLNIVSAASSGGSTSNQEIGRAHV